MLSQRQDSGSFSEKCNFLKRFSQNYLNVIGCKQNVYLIADDLGEKKSLSFFHWYASGPENVPNKLYKIIAPILSPHLSKIFNQCYEVGIFPSILKSAKVIPVYKSGPKDQINNYRPISILSPIAKIFEKLLF